MRFWPFVMTAGLGAAVTAMPMQQATFRSAVSLISIDVSVKAGNLPVAGLTAGDFVVLDNGVPQSVEAVAIEAIPIDATLFLDTSPSIVGAQPDLKADIAKIAALLRSADRLRLLIFDDQIRDVFGWRPAGTLDVAAVMHRVGTGEISAVYDGLSLGMMHRPDPDRRHLIIAMTDGRDSGSVNTSAHVLEIARRAESVLHLVIVSANSNGISRNAPGGWLTFWPSLPDIDGDANLETAAELTGGRVHGGPGPGQRVNTVKAFKAAFDDFRQSYVLRYELKGVPRQGWHDVDVKVKKPGRFAVRARRGYFGS